MNAVTKDTDFQDYKVRDISQAELGRRRIRMAEEEMPGLMQIRARYAKEKPLQGVRLSGSLHVTNGGYNPVLTIMALGLRGGDHIARSL